VWDRTHRFGGVCFVLAGLAAAAGALVVSGDRPMLWVLLVPVLAAVGASVTYSAVISPRVGRGAR
jgi:uncharacterized membrane protein